MRPTLHPVFPHRLPVAKIDHLQRFHSCLSLPEAALKPLCNLGYRSGKHECKQESPNVSKRPDRRTLPRHATILVQRVRSCTMAR